MNEDMKIILQASLDQSESAIKALKKDIAGLKDKLLDERLGLSIKLDTSENSVRKIKQDIDALKEKISSKKLSINYKLNLSAENRSALNSDIDKLSNNKSVHALKLRVQLNLDGDAIGKLNKQIDTLSSKLSTVKITANIDTSSIQGDSVTKDTDKVFSGESISREATDTEKIVESRQKINNLLKESQKFSANQVRAIQEMQNSVVEIQKDMVLTDSTGKQIGKTTEIIHNYAQATNTLYRQQKQLQKEIYDWEKLKANADDEQLLEINEIINSKRKIIQENDAILKGENLQNAELQKQLDTYSKMVQMKQSQQESVRLAKLGTEITGGKDIQYGDAKSIEEWAKSMHNANVAVTNMKTKTKGLNEEQTQFTVTTKSSKGMVTEYTYALDKATGKVFKMGERTREAGRRTLDFMNDIKIAIARTFQWNIAMGAIYGTMNKMKDGISFIKTLDADLTQVAIVTGQTREQVSGLVTEYLELAKATSKTVAEISAVNAELIRQGLSMEESSNRLNTVLKLSSVADMDVNETLSVITSSVNALGESAEKTADVLVHAGNVSASGVDTIGTAMTKVASSAKSAEMSIEQLTGITATLIDVTQEAPETLGNSLKSIISRFSAVNEETGELNESFNDVQEAFESFDIDFTDVEGQIRPVYELLDEMGEKWKTLDKNQKNYVATQAGGTMQGNRFIAMMENWNRVAEITTELQENAIGVTDNAYEKWLDSVEAKVNNLTIAWEELWVTTINTDAVKGALEALTSVINGVNIAINKFGVEGLASGLVAVGMAHKFSLFSKTAKVLGRDWNGLVSIFKKSGQVFSGLTSTMKSMFSFISKNGVNSFKLFTGAMKKSTQGTKLHTEAMALCDIIAGKMGLTIQNRTTIGLRAYASQIAVATAQTVAFNVAVGVATSLLTFGFSTIITGIVSSLGGWLFKSKEVTTEIQDQNKELKESIKLHRQNVKALKDSSKEFSTLQEKVGENGETTALTADEQERYNELVNKLVEIAPTVVDYYDDAGNAVLKYGTSLDEIIAKEEALANIEKDKVLSNSDALLDEVKVKIKELESKKAIYEKMQETGGSERSAKWFTTWGKSSIAESVSIKNHEKEVQKLNDLILNGTEEQKRVAKEVLADIERDYAKVSAGIRVVNSQLEEQKETLRQIVDIDMEDTFGNLDMSDAMKNVGRNFVTTAFSDAFDKDIDTAEDAGYEAINKFEEIFGKLQNTLDDNTPKSISDNEEELRALIKSLEDVGYPTEVATELIYEMTNAMVSSSNAGNNLVMAMNLITETAKKQYSEINKLQASYQKLAKGERLSTDEIMEMVELYPDLIKYMEETGDLTLKNGEIIKEVYEAKYNQLIADIELQKQEKQILITNAEEERRAIEGNLQTYKLLFGEKSRMYQEEFVKMEENNRAIEDAKKSLDKLTGQAKVYKQMFSEDFSAQNIANLSDIYDDATNKIKFYQDTLNEIRKNGELAPETIQKIMTSHHELIGVLGDESGMYNLLMELIKQEGSVQKETYRQMLYNSDGFYKSMIDGHSDMFKRIADIYNLNLDDFTTMNQLMAEIAGQGASNIISEYQKINGVTRDVAIGNLISEKEAQLNDPTYAKPKKAEIAKELADLKNIQSIDNLADEKTEIKSKSINFKPTGSKSNSKKEKSPKNTIDLVKLETDAYLRLKKAMEDVERQQKRNERMYDYATGSDKIKLLTKEIDLMSKQQSIASALANQYREESDVLKKELSKTIGMNDGTYGINNFNAYMKAQEDVINGLVKKINASVNDEKTYESLTKQKDKLEKQVKEFKGNFEKYIELTLNTIPDLGDEWWELVYEKFERTLEIMETDLQKFEKQADRVSKRIDFILQGKNDNTKNLEKEYGLIKDIAGIYQEEIKNIQDKIEANSKMVTHYENQLNKIEDKQSSTYEQASRYLILARAEQDKLAEALSSSLDNYSSQLNSQISKHVELLDKMKEKAIETFTKMRDELDKFSVKEFEVSLDTIIAELDRIDGIFMDGAEFKLDTSDARDNISGLDKNIKKMYNGISKFTEEGKKIAERTVKTEEDSVKQKEDLLALIEEQIEYENNLKELYTEISEELADATLEYKKIEDALQSIIDAKQEELDTVKEQFEEEEAITAMIEKRLALLKAMDDTRFSYITGQGEEVFGYDVSNVNALKQELGKAQREEEKDELINKMEEELAEMQEKLSKTQEIHQQELAVLQSAQDNVSSMLDLLEENLDTNLGDHMDKIYENLTDVYIDNLQTELETQTTLLDNLYTLMDDRLPINTSKITESVNTGGLSSSGKNITIEVGKNQSSLGDIARAYNTDVSKLLKLNSGLKEDTVLKYGQQIKIPSFDTGGYTGDFGNEGRVGILHEKELILNKEDTSNVLEAVDIARFIASGLGAGIASPQSLEQVTNNSNTEQKQIIENINIHGVKDVNDFSNQIQKVFRNGMARLS